MAGSTAAKAVNIDVTGNVVNAVPTDATWAADMGCLEARQEQSRGKRGKGGVYGGAWELDRTAPEDVRLRVGLGEGQGRKKALPLVRSSDGQAV
jgi:hypothetical protein